MLERDEYPPGVPCWVDVEQPDPDAAVAFYGDLFDWECEELTPAGAPQRYFIARLRGRDVAGIGSRPEGAGSTPAWNTYVCVDRADEAAAAAVKAGGRVLQDPTDVARAGRMAVLSDRSGAEIAVWEAKERKGAQLVNQPGTWVFSELYTRDVAAAKAFYGAVFGWRVSGTEAEGTDFWRLDGYGDFLAQRDPAVRDIQNDAGAPEGFEDAVAWLVPMTSEHFPDDTPPHWNVTFGVDDADKVAERTVQLGGRVLVAPMDAPWVRLAVLSDPQGTVFTASKFVPPT